jgi:7-carboxy-7-deazaguanine synthase
MDTAGSPGRSVPLPGPGELVVSEIFGPTFQGEGPSLGRRAGFVRLGRCNLDCGKGPGATWACDTPYTWDWDTHDPVAELQVLAVTAMVDSLSVMDIDLVVITGGEPLVQQRRLLPLLRALCERGWETEIETNGTIAPLPEVTASVTRFNVSPKLSGSGVPAERGLRPDALTALRASGRAVFKFVVADPRELDEVASVAHNYELAPIWIMPAGTTAEDVLSTGRTLADPVLARGWHLTTRLHVLLWGNQRGR